jgi:hypothetical protein
MKWQLVKTGKFAASKGGKITIDRDFLVQLAQNSPGKIPIKGNGGHEDPRPGEWAAGWIDGDSLEVLDEGDDSYLLGNISLNEHGKLLIDNGYYGTWSIEASKIDNESPWRLTALALLGAEAPAIPGLKQVAASLDNDEKATVFFSNKNFNLFTENDMELKEQLKEAKHALTMALESHKDEKLELSAKIAESEKEIKNLKEEKAELEKSLAEYKKSSFEASLKSLRSIMMGKAPTELIDELITGYEKDGVNCAGDVQRQITIWEKAMKMVSLGPSESVKLAQKQQAEKEAEEKENKFKALHPKGL